MEKRIAYNWICLCLFLACSLASIAQIDLINNGAYEQLDIKPVNWINTSSLEFSPGKYKEGLFYIASGEKQDAFDKSLNESFFEIRFAGVENPDDSLSAFISKLNSQSIHKGPGSFSAQNSVFYFTQENRATSPGTKSTLEILCISKKMDAWTPVQLPFSMARKYSYCHPSANEKNSILIFASNIPGGYGGMDLYITQKRDSEWTEPVNLGPDINSDGNELFPYLHKDKTLFFASDRVDGFGGLDLYVSSLENHFTQILRPPFNSEFDDFGVLLNEDGFSGYFSSDRLGESTKDDIFQFILQKPFFAGIEYRKPDKEGLTFWVRDDQTGVPLENVEAYLKEIQSDCDVIKIEGYDIEMKKDEADVDVLILKLNPTHEVFEDWLYQTNSGGILRLPLTSASQYILILKKEGYKLLELILNPKDADIPKDVFMKPIAVGRIDSEDK